MQFKQNLALLILLEHFTHMLKLFFQQLTANWVLGLLVIVVVDWQAKQGSLGSGRQLKIKEINVLKGTPGKNVETFHHVQVTIYNLVFVLYEVSFESKDIETKV